MVVEQPRFEFEDTDDTIELSPEQLFGIAKRAHEHILFVRGNRRAKGRARSRRTDKPVSHTEASFRMTGMLEALRVIDPNLPALVLILNDETVRQQLEKPGKSIHIEQPDRVTSVSEYAGGVVLLAAGIDRTVQAVFGNGFVKVRPGEEADDVARRMHKHQQNP